MGGDVARFPRDGALQALRNFLAVRVYVQRINLPNWYRYCLLCHRARNSAVALCRLGRHRRWIVRGVGFVLRVLPALVGCNRGAPEAPRSYKKEGCSLVLEGVLEWCRSFVA